MAQRRRTYAESASLPDKKRENEEFRETKVVRVHKARYRNGERCTWRELPRFAEAPLK